MSLSGSTLREHVDNNVVISCIMLFTNCYCGHQTNRDGIGWECSTHVRMINAG
jgi:hypothetical protein